MIRIKPQNPKTPTTCNGYMLGDAELGVVDGVYGCGSLEGSDHFIIPVMRLQVCIVHEHQVLDHIAFIGLMLFGHVDSEQD